MNAFLNALVSGINSGALYAIMALGMTIIYGVSRVFNFGHGIIAVIGGYIAWGSISGMGLPLLPSMLIALIVMALFGWLTYRAFIGPLFKKPNWEISTILFMLGFGIMLENILLQIFGPRVKAIEPFLEGNLRIMGIRINYHDFVLIGIVTVGVLLIYAFFKHTKTGQSMRAVAQSMDGARVVGIDINKIFSYTFALGFAVTGFSGILLSTKYYMTPHTGWEFMSKGFVIVAFGGLGNPLGAILAALILGIIEGMTILYIGTVWIWPVWFAVFVIILLIRPQGILGGRAI